MKLSEIRIEIKNEKRIKKFLLIWLLTFGITYLFCLGDFIPSRNWTRVYNTFVYLILPIPAFLAYRKSQWEKEKIVFKNYKQYLWVIPLVAILLVWVSVYKDLYGVLTGGTPLFEITPGDYLYGVFEHIIIVGVIEEFVFRVYMQGELKDLFGRFRWLAPFVVAFIFGWWHIITRHYHVAFFTFGMGLLFGYCKYFFKNCTYLSVALAHGVYNYIVAYIWI